VPNEFVINKTFAQRYFNNLDVLGKKIYSNGEPVNVYTDKDTSKIGIITGVVENADFYPLHFKAPALGFCCNTNGIDFLQIYINPLLNKNIEKDIDDVFKSFSKDFCFKAMKKNVEYEYKDYYREDNTNRKVITLFAFIISLITLIGVYTITQTHIRNHLKDICIHKTLGAQPAQIIKRYSKPYVIMFVFSTAIGLFVSYYMSKLFISLFIIQISSLPMLFLLSVVICGLLLFIPLIINILIAYNTKPVEYLGKE
jgi:ABC-type antimicrobial peptide transport system permease subunit